MSAIVKIELSCRRCSATVICDVSNDDSNDRDPSAVRAGAPKRPPNWTHVQMLFAAFSVREYGDLCPACTAEFLRFVRGHVVDPSEKIDGGKS